MLKSRVKHVLSILLPEHVLNSEGVKELKQGWTVTYDLVFFYEGPV